MSTADNEDDAVDVCSYAFNAAMEEGMKHCDGEEAQMAVLGKIVGVDGESIYTSGVLSDGPSASVGDDQTREWVAARAKEIIDTEGTEPLSAINQAWAEVGDEMPDPDDEGEAEVEPDDGDDPDPEAEVEPDPEPEPDDD